MVKTECAVFLADLERCEVEIVQETQRIACVHSGAFGPSLATTVSVELGWLLQAGACPTDLHYILDRLRPVASRLPVLWTPHDQVLVTYKPDQNPQLQFILPNGPSPENAACPDLVQLIFQLSAKYDRLAIVAALAAVLHRELRQLSALEPDLAESAWLRIRESVFPNHRLS